MKTDTQIVRKLDWGRIEMSIKQRFRREPDARARVGESMECLRKIVDRAGDKTKCRKALRNIGISLAVNKDRLQIISCICLSVPPGDLKKAEVSKLVHSHVAFLKSFGDALPPWELTCLFPPPEREDRAAEIYIAEVCELTKQYYWILEGHLDEKDERPVSCELMTNYAPGMIAMEDIVIEEICASPHLSRLCEGFITQRSDYYKSLGIDPQLWPRKNRRTMAQYIILGRLAALHGSLMCSHTTVNIHCALYGGAGVLHNPVGFR